MHLIALVDADVVLDKDWANHCLEAMNTIGIAAVKCSVYRTGHSFTEQVYKKMLTVAYGQESIGSPIVINTASVLVKKNALEKIGWFDEELKKCERFDLTYRLLHSGFHVAYTHRAKSYVIAAGYKLVFNPLMASYFRARIYY